MVLEQLSIVNYRNIADALLRFSPNINCLIGNNGAGKTNVLDAIYFLSFCHPANTTQDAQAIRHTDDYFVLEGTYTSHPSPLTSHPSPLTSHPSPLTPHPLNIFAGMKRGQKKHFKRNGKEYQRLSDHIGLIPIVMVSPADTLLIEGGSEERRRLMDQVIAQQDRQYIDALNRYNKALMQRNAMLRDEEHEPDAALMDLLEEQMAASGETVAAARTQLIEALEPLFQHYYDAVSGGHEKVSLAYVSHCQRGPLLDVIRRDRHKDRAVGYSLHGIHRDDLDIMLDGHPMRREGSQGQLKTFVIALKLAQYDLLTRNDNGDGGEMPLLLLDDIFDKLDATRVENIVRLVATRQFGQIFITDTNREHIDKILRHGDFDYRLFSVSDGAINLNTPDNV